LKKKGGPGERAGKESNAGRRIFWEAGLFSSWGIAGPGEKKREENS